MIVYGNGLLGLLKIAMISPARMFHGDPCSGPSSTGMFNVPRQCGLDGGLVGEEKRREGEGGVDGMGMEMEMEMEMRKR